MKAKDLLLRAVTALLFVAAIALSGCSSGSDRAAEVTGSQDSATIDLAAQSPETLAALTLSGEVTEITTAGPPVVRFKVTDDGGRGVTGLGGRDTTGALSFLRFNLVKLVPEQNGSPSEWVSYIGPNATTAARPGTERTGALVDNGDGSYIYTFVNDVTLLTNPITYEPSLTHRLAIQLSGGGLSPLNLTYDFVPAGAEVVETRDIVTTAACNECHDRFTFHGGNRQDVRFCVTCHTAQRATGRTPTTSTNGTMSGETFIVDGEVLGNFVTLVHKIHMGRSLSKKGYDYEGVRFDEIGYPQSPANCRKCHDGTATAQGDNWKTRPSRVACGACHDAVDFASGANHPAPGGSQGDDSKCTECHDGDKIETAHLSLNPTPHNPGVPTGAATITYVLNEVTVDNADHPVVTFTVLADGVPMNLATYPPAGFTSGPSFLAAYALPQDGVTVPRDYNNLGRNFGQPVSVPLADVIDAGIANADGSYTVTLAAATFPAGATLRAVVMQGAFTQTGMEAALGIDFNNDGDLLDGISRQTPMVVKAVTGDPVRREVVDSAKCGNCHEWFIGHGGSRVYNVQGCLVCHNPSMTASGRAIVDPSADALAIGPDPLLYPEVPGNFREMIHGFHGRQIQENPYVYVRNRNNGVVVSSDHVEFPSRAGNCLLCHKTDTFALPLTAGLLPVTDRITGIVNGRDADSAAIIAARAAMPNPTDWVNTPIASACVYCHDSTAAMVHVEQNGGAVRASRQDLVAADPVETCDVCHGAGAPADLKIVHSLK